MTINEDVLIALDEYHAKSLIMQKTLYDKVFTYSSSELEKIIDDDLIFKVPIYDMLDRKYAAFSSFPEAIMKKEKDPKGNGLKYKDHQIKSEFDLFMCFYLFRLCGSGINYKPGSHGFGNFWIYKDILLKKYTYKDWLQSIPLEKFSDNKGYMLPQFNIGLRKFIVDYSFKLVSILYESVQKKRTSIIEFVEIGNKFMIDLGFKRTTFVLSAFAADVAEYFPNYVDPNSMIYAGTNAKKCLKAIFGKVNEEKAIFFLSERYGAPPYSVEDSRLCDPVRYFLEYQSKYHIEKNNGFVYKNNSILKKIWNQEKYQNFLQQLA